MEVFKCDRCGNIEESVCKLEVDLTNHIPSLMTELHQISYCRDIRTFDLCCKCMSHILEELKNND